MRLGRETRPATAGGRSAGVLDDELRAFEIFLVVDLRADQVLIAHRVDQQRHAVFLHGRVVVVDRFVEREAILESGAAAAGDKDPQLEFGVALFLDQGFHFFGRAVGENERGGHFGDGVHTRLLTKYITHYGGGPAQGQSPDPDVGRFSSTTLPAAGPSTTSLPSTVAPTCI